MSTFVDNNKIFACVYGKEFTNSQSFNGHKSHCKAHQLQKYGNLDKLQDMQYIVFRIKWNEINSQSGKDLMKKKIDNFLEFYDGI